MPGAAGRIAKDLVEHWLKIQRLPVLQFVNDDRLIGGGVGVQILDDFFNDLHGLNRRGNNQRIGPVVGRGTYFNLRLLLGDALNFATGAAVALAMLLLFSASSDLKMVVISFTAAVASANLS